MCADKYREWPSPKPDLEPKQVQGFLKRLFPPSPRVPSRASPNRSLHTPCDEHPSMETIAVSACEMAKRFMGLNIEERDEVKQLITAFLERNAYIPANPEIAADPWYERAIKAPICFIEILLRSAKLGTLLTDDGERMYEDSDIEMIQNMITTDLVQLCVKRRKATWLINMAASACFSGFAKAGYRGIQNSRRNLRAAVETFNKMDKSNVVYVEEVTGQISDCKKDLIRNVWASVIPNLMEGVDIANYDGDHFIWPIPAGLNGGAKLRYILDNDLIPTLVGTDERNKDEACKEYIRRLGQARRPRVRANSEPSAVASSGPSSGSSGSSDPSPQRPSSGASNAAGGTSRGSGGSGGKRKTKRARRKQRMTRRR